MPSSLGDTVPLLVVTIVVPYTRRTFHSSLSYHRTLFSSWSQFCRLFYCCHWCHGRLTGCHCHFCYHHPWCTTRLLCLPTFPLPPNLFSPSSNGCWFGPPPSWAKAPARVERAIREGKYVTLIELTTTRCHESPDADALVLSLDGSLKVRQMDSRENIGSPRAIGSPYQSA